MNIVLLWILRIVGIAISAGGLIVVYGAPWIVDRKGLAAKKTLDPRYAEHLSPEDQDKQRRHSAILDVKLIGLVIAAPGFALLLFAFR